MSISTWTKNIEDNEEKGHKKYKQIKQINTRKRMKQEQNSQIDKQTIQYSYYFKDFYFLLYRFKNQFFLLKI